jgi:hypothetical protein
MKTIPTPGSDPKWSNHVLNDILFIKKHLRYPLSKKTIPPAFMLTLAIVYISRLFWITVVLHSKVGSLLNWLLICLVFILIVAPVYRYWQIFRFTAIPTPFFANDNGKLVEEFLLAQQLLVYRHPQSPDVFQIASRPLGNNTDQREVMVFIADDKRILINSHFINQRFVLSTASRNYKMMAKMLKEWLAAREAGNITAVTQL